MSTTAPAEESTTPTPRGNPFEDFEGHQSTDLTPQRAHYLKKYLIQLQFRRELDAITTTAPNGFSTLSYLGPPFSAPPKNVPPLDLPLLRYVFRQFVVTFPFMAAAPKDFYSEKLQPFVQSLLTKDLSSVSAVEDEDSDHPEHGTRERLLAKLERNMALFVGSATKLVEREEVVRLSQADLNRLEALGKKRQAKMAKQKDVFEVNIVSVRTVTDKGRMRSRIHEEFIIRTRRSRYPDVYVSRRYGDFRTLANELRKLHPEETIRPPPAKDRTMVSAPSAMSPLSPLPSRQQSYWDDSAAPMTPPISPDYSQHSIHSMLAREKNRLTLRSYLHSLLSSANIASSPVLKSFLLSGPTTLSPEEVEDARRREEADRVRDAGRKHFASEIAGRVDSLRDAVRSVKGDMMGKDGLTNIFSIVKSTPDIRQLPANYQAVVEWARISLASKIFQHFVASDDASESFASLKRIHGLMPYFMLKATLKISNPIAMMRSVLDLFMAQPFGGRSLLQKMFTSSLSEEVKILEEQIEAVKDKIDDPVMSAKIRQFAYAPREIQEVYKADASAENLNVFTVILRAQEEPVLNRGQLHRLSRAQHAYRIYLKHRESLEDSDDDDGPQDEDAWLLEDLKVLCQLYSRLRGREQLIALIFEGSTAELLKDMITIFYSPLAQVYRAASIADSLSDLQNFINDLIRTVEQVEEVSQEDPHRTVQAFIDLVQRHEQSFYHFVHKVHSKGQGLFDGLMRWIELFLTVVREGLGEPISLEFILPHMGSERDDVMVEVDQLALYHYKRKLLYENKIRRRFGRAQGQDDDAEEEATQALVDSVVGELGFSGSMQREADEIAAEDTDEDSDDSSSEYESTSDESGSASEDSESTEGSVATGRGPTQTITIPRSGLATPKPMQSSNSTPMVSKPPQPVRQSLDTRPQTPPAIRKRSLSLKSMRSMTFSLGGNQDGSSRKGKDRDIPPVPPLPPLPMTAGYTNPMPRTPTMSTISQRPVPQSSPGTPMKPLPKLPGSPKAVNKGKKAAKPKKIIKPPELKHIPQLLPLFTEMMRPLLLPRKVSQPVAQTPMPNLPSSSATVSLSTS
ncbi:hypothetical protein BDN72DRAFT_831324 [Pluteus cervinus]|uniref:Uncharacterized protein n=1 Tax=Pluteus cervinus TaxID=181527 RepID=A0ACD3BE11_9AGAR|nr:hypothetical protein BDN72DRAFT_831324 [Pluteus cervinus]